jgi:hypothetical protein
MIRLSLAGVATLALVLVTSSNAQAQFGRNFRIPPVVQDIMMMSSAEVQKELTLSPEQTKSVNDIATEMRTTAMEIMSGLQDLTPEEQKEELANVMKMVTEEAKNLQVQVDEILDDKQTARMKELSLQRRNVEALEDKEVAESLKLTEEQGKKLIDIRNEAADKQDAIIQEAIKSGGDRSKIREKIEELRKELGDKALAVLTTEQREQFDKMKGAKFNFPRQRGFGF